MSCFIIIWESKNVNKFLKMSMCFFILLILFIIFLFKVCGGWLIKEEDIKGVWVKFCLFFYMEICNKLIFKIVV